MFIFPELIFMQRFAIKCAAKFEAPHVKINCTLPIKSTSQESISLSRKEK